MEQLDYSIKFLPIAYCDLQEAISSYTMFGSKKGAERILEKVKKCLTQLQTFPYSGVVVPDEKLAKLGYRMYVIEKYILFYTIKESDKRIYIGRFLNAKRKYSDLFNNI